MSDHFDRAGAELAVMAHSPALARELGRLPVDAPLDLLERHLHAGGSPWARSQSYLREAR